MLGVAFATAALIVVLSVFNGLEELLRSLYTSFDPQLKIEAAHGKSFVLTDSLRNKIKQVDGVEILTEVIEDYVYLRYLQPDALPDEEAYTTGTGEAYQMPKGEAEMVVTMKGVSDNFIEQHRLDDRIISGELKLYSNERYGAIIGRGIKNTLSVSMENDVVPLQLFYVKNLKANSFNPSSMYARQVAIPTAVFTIEKNFDENYIFVPLALAQELMNYGDKRTSLEIKLKPGSDPKQAQRNLKTILGAPFQILSNDEQHRDLYRILNMEKLFMALALTLLIAIASINIFFSLMMLVIDKKKDISILTSLGATSNLIQKIFVSEAFVISGIGTILGLAVGAGLCLLQKYVGLVGLGMANAVVTDYPVKLVYTDFIFLILVIVTITGVIAWVPAKAAAKTAEPREL